MSPIAVASGYVEYHCGCTVPTTSIFFLAGYEMPRDYGCDLENARWYHDDLRRGGLPPWTLVGELVELAPVLAALREDHPARHWLIGRWQHVRAALRGFTDTVSLTSPIAPQRLPPPGSIRIEVR